MSTGLIRRLHTKGKLEPISGDLWADFSKPLVKGGYGVYEGLLRDVSTPEKVAVKFVKVESRERLEREIVLSRLTRHLNVLLFLKNGWMGDHDQVFFIVTDLCRRDTLYEMVTEKKLTQDQIKVAMLQFMSGLSHLHSMSIVHRDLHPKNILFSLNGRYLKISDLDQIKQIESGRSRITMSLWNSVDPDAWLAPEIQSGGRCSYKSDVYNAGRIFIFMIFAIEHNINVQKRLKNLVKNRELEPLKFDDVIEAMYLIETMTQDKENFRPTAEEILKYPFFWNSKKRFTFFEEMNDYFAPFHGRKECPEPDQITKIVMQDLKPLGSNWLWTITESTQIKKISNRLIEIAEGIRPRNKYDHSSTFDLFRFIRNLCAHYRDDSILNTILKSSDDLWNIIVKYFPDLLSQVYRTIKKYWPIIADSDDFPPDAVSFFVDNPPYKFLNLPREEE